MDNFLEGGIAQLEAAKAAVNDLAEKEQTCKELDRTLKARQKELEIQKKRVEEKISAALKKTRANLDKEYDGQIATAEKAIKDAEIKKKNAKSAAVNLRMKQENSSLIDENKVLQAEINARFKEAGVPAICRNAFYYALFQPGNKMDYLICAIVIVICAFVIPFLITRLVSTVFLAVIVWILIILFFAAIYFLVSSWTKKGARNDEIVKERPAIDRISENKRHIKKKNKNIKADPDESQYNLTEYDNQIAMAKNEYEDLRSQKEAAVKNFEEVESVSIREKMETEYASTIEDIQKTINFATDELNTKNVELQEAEKTAEEYRNYLGDKNMKPEKIDELIAAISEGRATSISDALEAQKTK